MAKVYLNTSTKIEGKLVLAGEVEVTAEQEKDLNKKGFIGKKPKSKMPTNEKEIKALVAENEKLNAKKEIKK